MVILIVVVLLLIVLFLVSVWPGHGRPEEMKDISCRYIAHRGLHDGNTGPLPENSMAAYKKAVEMGYGIELDVRESADGELICMHDRNLKRACGVDVNADALKLSELQELKLFSSEERIPLFKDVLAMVDGRVPIVMEVKAETIKMAKSVSEKTAKLLDSYEGPICMESFHPVAVRWYRKNRPDTLRGQLSEKFSEVALPLKPGAFAFSCCVTNFITKPDFIAYNVLHRDLLRFRLMRSKYHAVCAAWIVDSEEQLRQASRAFDIYIFEGFEPKVRC